MAKLHTALFNRLSLNLLLDLFVFLTEKKNYFSVLHFSSLGCFLSPLQYYKIGIKFIPRNLSMNKTPKLIKSKHRVTYLKTGPKSLSILFGKIKLRADVGNIFSKKSFQISLVAVSLSQSGSQVQQLKWTRSFKSPGERR